MSIPTLTLNSGLPIPVVGLGTYQSENEDGYLSTKAAIKCGYRHIDTAMIYFNEEQIGRAVKECIEEGIVKREDLFITTKLWNDCHHPDDVEWACRESLKRLGLDYMDLYLIHWPVASNRINRENRDTTHVVNDDFHYTETWKAMEKLPALGLAKSIGVSNFVKHQLEDILKICTIKPAINQIEVHPYFFRTELIDFCKSHGIIVEAFAPLGSPGNPFGIHSDLMARDDIKAVAEKHGVTTAQVLLRFCVQDGLVILPKSIKAERIKANADIFGFELTSEEMKMLHGLNNNTIFYPCNAFKPSKYWPFHY